MKDAIRRLTMVTAAAALVLAGCGYDETPVPEPEAEPEHSSTPTECSNTGDVLRSEPPDDSGGSTVAEIRADEDSTAPDRRVLRVGVSADTNLMAARNPQTNRIVGFDIEVVKAIGEAIFGPDFNLNTDVQLRVITAKDRIPLLGGEGQERELDLVVRNFTINSCRKEEIAFSAEYYHATQKVLVRSDVADDYSGPADLAGEKVCAPTGSTSLDYITEAARRDGAESDPILEPADNHTGCLVKFQRGEVEAITGDDTVLAGLAAQDPYAEVPEQDPIHDEPYGVGVPLDDPELVAFVNAVLADFVDDSGGTSDWQRAYNQFLKKELGQCDANTEDCEPGDQGFAPTPLYH